MNKPRFIYVLLRMALLMLVAFVLVLTLIRGAWVMPLIFSGIPLAGVLENILFKPIEGLLGSGQRLEAAMWLIIFASYLQWTLLGALLSYVWQIVRYRRFLATQSKETV